MSYYFKSGNKIYSDTVAGANKIKHMYIYKTLLDSKDTNGVNYSHQWFYIKDGTRPWFDPVCSDGAYHSDQEIDKLTYNYMPVLQFAISSISGKYNFSNDFVSYYIPYNTTPMLCDKELIKYNSNTETFEPLITNVDYSKGGRIYWRMSEKNLMYYDQNHRGPTVLNGWHDTDTSGQNLCYDNGNSDFYNVNFSPAVFVFPNSTATNPLNNSVARFIKSTPYYVNGLNKFGFTVYDPSIWPSNEYTPPHFTLDISQIKAAGYNKLKVKIDGLYLYGNNDFSQYNTNVVFKDNAFVNNAASFSSDLNITGTNPYCQALVYAITDEANWELNSITPGKDYLNNGTIFSNLTKATQFVTDMPVVSRREDYTIKYFSYNDSTVKEEQSLDNINVWKHMYLKFVQDNKMYSGVQSEIGICPNSAAGKTAGGFCVEDCPICGKLQEYVDYEDVNAHGGVNTRILFCKENIFGIGDDYLIDKCKNYLLSIEPEIKIGNSKIKTYPIAKHYGNAKYAINTINDVDVYGIKVPVFSAVDDEEPFAYYIAANYIPDDKNKIYNIKYNDGSVCNGNNSAFKMSGTTAEGHYITHTAGDGWKAGEREYIPYYKAVNSYDKKPIKKFGTNYFIPCLFCGGGAPSYKLSCYCCQENDDENLKVKYANSDYERGKIKHRDCFGLNIDKTINYDEPGKGYYLPYKKNEIYYRFKFYGNNIKKGKNEFDGFITSGNLSLVSGVNKKVGNDAQFAYKEIKWDNWKSQKDTGPSGAYTYKETTSADFVDYRSIFFGDDTEREGNIFLDEIPDDKWSALSSQWMVYSYVGNNNYDYYYGHNNSDRPARDGIKANTTFDLVWKGTDTDKYRNDTPSIAQTFKPNGMSPSAGCNYTYSNVILENTIDLTNKTGYLQICYPYVTVYGTATNVNRNCGIIPQMIMTYEGTN